MEAISQIPKDILLLLGVLLLTLFVVVFWTKKRRKRKTAVNSGRSTSSKLRVKGLAVRLLRLGGFAIFTFFIIVLVLTVYLSNQTVMAYIAPAPQSVEAPADFSLPIEEITFMGGDNLTMAAWYVPSQNGSVIILLHGYGSTRTAMTWHAERLYEAGYGLLMYDERASGESEGEQRSYGWQDAVDVGGAIRYLQSKPELNQGQIGIVGCSVGGQIALQGAAYYPQIQAVWADGAATIRAKDMLPKTHPILLLARPSSYLIDWMMAQKLEMTLPSAIIEIIGTIDKPIMLVAGGTPLPLYGAESEIQARFASFAAENAEVWVIDEAVHCDGPQHRPEEYGARLVAFFDDALDLGE